MLKIIIFNSPPPHPISGFENETLHATMIYIFIQHLIDRLLRKTRKFRYFKTYPVCIKLYSLVDQENI